MRVDDFDYDLPEGKIAQEPLADRAGARMLLVDRARGCWEDLHFRHLPQYLGPGDCLAVNDSRVFPSRLFGHREGVRAMRIGKHNRKRREYLSGEVEVFLLRPVSSDARTWDALVRPGRKMRLGERVLFEGGLDAVIVAHREFGERTLRFSGAGDFYEQLDRIGHVPLPPYIRRPDAPEDRDRYQTVFAQERGSVAAPTAGLHFTNEMLERCRAAGAELATITLHVGLGTFQPLHGEAVEEAKLHSERYSITESNQRRMEAANRVVAVGTTTVRTIESAARSGQSCGETDLFIYPGFEFRRTGAILTNFHLPKSSLLILVCAFGGTELIRAAYAHAIAAEYRFYSYGDCMLIV